MEDTVEVARIDRCRGRAGTVDDEIVSDVQIAGSGEVLEKLECQEIRCVGGQSDDVGAGQSVRSDDRLTQGAVGRHAAIWCGVIGAGDSEGCDGAGGLRSHHRQHAKHADQREKR